MNIRKTFPLTASMQITASTCLHRDSLTSDNVRIVGQVNQETIVCLLLREGLLLAFDQHAVHERIRYERLLADSITMVTSQNSCGQSTLRPVLVTQTIKPPFELNIVPEAFALIINAPSDKLLEFFGLVVKVKDAAKFRVSVEQVPKYFKDFELEGPFNDYLMSIVKYFEGEGQLCLCTSKGIHFDINANY